MTTIDTIGRGLRGAVWLLALGLLTSPASAQQIDETRDTLEQWVETRRVLSNEKRDWALGKELLTERIELVKREVASLQERIASAEESIAEADRKRDELVAENDRLKGSSDALAKTVGGLEERARKLLAQMPEWVQERVRPLSQQFPDDPEDTRLSLGQRFQNVIGVLDTVNKLHRQITTTSELRTLPDGSTAEVSALYVGLSMGYFVTADGLAAGVGSGTPEGWAWTPADQAAEQITHAIAIHQDEKSPEFVPLPMRID